MNDFFFSIEEMAFSTFLRESSSLLSFPIFLFLLWRFGRGRGGSEGKSDGELATRAGAAFDDHVHQLERERRAARDALRVQNTSRG